MVSNLYSQRLQICRSTQFLIPEVTQVWSKLAVSTIVLPRQEPLPTATMRPPLLTTKPTLTHPTRSCSSLSTCQRRKRTTILPTTPMLYKSHVRSPLIHPVAESLPHQTPQPATDLYHKSKKLSKEHGSAPVNLWNSPTPNPPSSAVHLNRNRQPIGLSMFFQSHKTLLHPNTP